MSISVIILLLIGALLYISGDVFSKKYADSPGLLFGLLAWISYSLTTSCWLPALTKFNSLSVLGTIWAVMTTLIAVLVGVFIFKESLTSIQMIGIVMAVISIILLNI
jgi:multidrug transporter EmrE-like cation transporter